MHKRIYITNEDQGVPGHKTMKNKCIPLLLCEIANGECKIKTLLVYCSENIRVFKKNNIMKSRLYAMWRASMKAWDTRQFFTEWIHEVFASSVKGHLTENSLPLKALLVMVTTPVNRTDLEEDLVG